MSYRRRSRWSIAGFTILLTLGKVPGVASAHEVAGTRFDAPLPLPLLFASAGATVALTAFWLALTDRVSTPSRRQCHLLTIPSAVATPVRYGLQALFLIAILTALIVGFVGRQVAAENYATIFTWPVWFRGVALVAIVIGSPWKLLSPWRTIYSGLVRLEGRTIAVLGEHPSISGAWTALVGFVVLLGVVENLTVIPRSPRLTAAIIATYALLMIGGAVLYGMAWLRQADPLGALYRLFGRVAPVRLSRSDDGNYDLVVRPPWQDCLKPVESIPLVLFVITMVYTVSFDGFANTRLFQTLLFTGRDALGTGPGTSIILYFLGLTGFVGAFTFVSWIVERIGAPGRGEWLAAARWFAPTVLPIAAAYEVAHNYPYVIRSLGRLFAITIHPLGPTVGPIDPLWWLSLPAFWGSQVVLIFGGHVIAVVAAHYVSLEHFPSRRLATRAHIPLTVLMIGYTVLSLWIVSQPIVSG